MARQRSPDRDKAFEIYKASKGEKPLVEIAEELGISEGTVRGWKNKDKWNDKLNGTFRKIERNVPKDKERSKPKNKPGKPALKENQYAKGNKGGSAPARNTNAVKHGLFRKIIPQDDLRAMELLEEIENHGELDMLWNSIQLQYFNILNSQHIMHVRGQNDISKETISESMNGEAYTVQFAWDKQANLLNAYAKAMNTLTSMIERFNKLANVDDERRMKLEQMKLGIEKTKAEIKELTDDSNGNSRVIIVNDKEAMRKAMENDQDS
ncbi:phage terminase small subunit [Bacillus sp. AFS075034]|uniref:phage terminase small subunit n=1 Tax=Bacillus sp. AFS075034 TaxID=2034281 RepID=UPI000BF375F3|nr:phage terminase small subunit [Bacillus sp. AFS075034]PFW65292.1 hypothetical protein COL20_01250 [Bacillus sp. AFS075034]